MPYVNFQEERAKAKKQLDNRKKNNDVIIKDINQSKDSLPFKVCEKWSFTSFKDKSFNNDITESEDKFLEIRDRDVVCARFERCKFFNIKFKGCNFIGCKFMDCEFGGGGVVFENCNFLLEKINNQPDLNNKDNLSCTFQRCSIYAKFFCSTINYLILEDCYVNNTSFEMTDMTSVIIINSQMKKINFIDVDLTGAKTINTYIEDMEFNDKLKSKLDEKSFFDKIEVRKNTKQEYEGIYMIYETVADKFNENNLKNNFGEYYYLGKNMQRKSLDKIIPKINSYIYWAVCGYGERVLHTLVTSLILIVIFALLYLLVGIEFEEIGKMQVSYLLMKGIPSTIGEFIGQFNEALYMSVGMFMSIGVDSSNPTVISYMISNIEIVLGTTMVGIGIGTITRKLIR